MAGNAVMRLIRNTLAFIKGQRGSGLIETVAALGILGAVGAVFLSAFSTGLRATASADEMAVAERLVRNQTEYIKDAAYDLSLPYEYPAVDHPAGYSITIDVDANLDNTLQTITISVFRDGKTLVTMDTFKVKGT